MNARNKYFLLLISASIVCYCLLLFNNFPSHIAKANYVTKTAKSKPPMTLIIGVPSVETNYEERMRLRMVTKQFLEVECPFCDTPHPDPQVRLLFFVGMNPETKVLADPEKIAHEQLLYRDLITLNITENMNEGKTWTMLKWIYDNTAAKFVMKSDEDSFVNVPALLARLAHFSETYPKDISRLYYGFPWNFDNVPLKPNNAIMIGMGYTLGWDLIRYIGTDPNVRSNRIGLEDAVTNEWLRNRTNVLRIGDRARFHDPPERKGIVSWTYRCDDVVVHQLKTNALWNGVKSFYMNCCPPFNAMGDKTCPGSAPSSTCCLNGTVCDRHCLPHVLRPVIEGERGDQYISDEDLDYL